ncbi:glucosidase [Granulicella sp. L60]|uniref:MGH1-like glycoside hydrolase domain-containing protein n=1 Tax=Granulicella sp. L60 TaxID=1641866 RepID=UPI00131EA916|nr:glucosidase [Granulicella sp. L60]
MSSEEQRRLEDCKNGKAWKRWGPYLSERQWGTVREDYSKDGDAWNYFTHDQARSRAYHWGEDGIAGYSDDKQRLCFCLALWNGHDPILKERIFGLTNSEGNHGEDVKEYYFYLDSTPTHSYMKYLYKYPHAAYPYEELLKVNSFRSKSEQEYELLDTGIFDQDRYFDVFVEYAKNTVDDTLIRLSISNRGPDPAPLRVLPTLWFRNTWQWWETPAKPSLSKVTSLSGHAILAQHDELGEFVLRPYGECSLLFTENDTNNARLFGGTNTSPFVKDAFHRYLVSGEKDAINRLEVGTKSAAEYSLTIGAGETTTILLRLCPRTLDSVAPMTASAIYLTMETRKLEADEFYAALTPTKMSADEANVMRQALAGMLWSKQHYFYDLGFWLSEHISDSSKTTATRNKAWPHMVNDDVISMPDKWEYPWYAAWDLAFHCLSLSIVDIDFAKHQLELMLDSLYLNPSGQVPAYEWNFGDVNPPVHAWAVSQLYKLEKQRTGVEDRGFLKRCFDKLIFNFSWWVNRKDPGGNNVFEGGFLGLDNIGVFDRSAKLPTGGSLEQADGTAWMAFFCENMVELSLELGKTDDNYQDLAIKFCQHFVWIAAAMDRIGECDDRMWDEQDGFFYDLLRQADGTAQRLKVRTMVGILPLCAATVFYPDTERANSRFITEMKAFIHRHPELTAKIAPLDAPGYKDRFQLSILNETKLRRVLSYLLDESEFLSTYGIRSLSRIYLERPYTFNMEGQQLQVAYSPAESDSGMFGGNSNWRGPIWMPVNFLLLRALGSHYLYYGDQFKVACPTGSNNMMNLFEVTEEIARRICSIFLRGESERRPIYGNTAKFQDDPHWRDHLLFYEYFHGDNGAGIGASHQTGWTGLVARLLQLFSDADSEIILNEATKPVFSGPSIYAGK